jgi:Transposase zinc-binding domain
MADPAPAECGVLDLGFARIRCNACAHEYLLAFSCKCREFFPNCHAKRLAIWAQWLNATLLAPVSQLHLHLLITDGGFQPDGTFVLWPAHDTARLTEAFRRAVLLLFARLAPILDRPRLSFLSRCGVGRKRTSGGTGGGQGRRCRWPPFRSVVDPAKEAGGRLRALAAEPPGSSCTYPGPRANARRAACARSR